MKLISRIKIPLLFLILIIVSIGVIYNAIIMWSRILNGDFVIKEYTERLQNEETATSGKQARLRQLGTSTKGNENVKSGGCSTSFNYMLEMWTCIPQPLQRPKSEVW